MSAEAENSQPISEQPEAPKEEAKKEEEPELMELDGHCMSNTCKIPYLDDDGKAILTKKGKPRMVGGPRKFKSDPKSWKMIVSKKNRKPRNSKTAKGPCPECGKTISSIVSAKLHSV
jgi:hypothetical protein